MNKLPEKQNKTIETGITALYAYTYLLLPLLLLPLAIWWAVTLVPFIWLHVTHWGLIHEAIHKHFAADSKDNERGGRLLAIMLGVSFHIVRFGHLIHHKLNRDWQSEIVPQK